LKLYIYSLVPAWQQRSAEDSSVTIQKQLSTTTEGCLWHIKAIGNQVVKLEKSWLFLPPIPRDLKQTLSHISGQIKPIVSWFMKSE